MNPGLTVDKRQSEGMGLEMVADKRLSEADMQSDHLLEDKQHFRKCKRSEQTVVEMQELMDIWELTTRLVHVLSAQENLQFQKLEFQFLELKV